MEENERKGSPAKIYIGGIILLVVIAAGVIILFIHQRKNVAADRSSRLDVGRRGPLMKVARPSRSNGIHELVLIGEVRPFRSVILYAKTSGYLENISVDKGDRVTEGQLLATIIAPEIDNDYNAAVADLDNKKKILGRDQSLLEKQYISHQDKEQSETAVIVAESKVKSLAVQQQYKNLRAPFSGTVTARYADPGALMQNATNASTGALPVVTISQLDKVRIYVYVEQKDAGFLKQNYPVDITMTEKPDVRIHATITRIAGELDPKTRMMLTEIDLQNKDNQVIPGSYVQVHILSPELPHLVIPREALVIRSGKYFVMSVANDSTIHSVPVTVGTNAGDAITILSGIQDSVLLALNAGLRFQEGQKIRYQKE